ncbi:Argininosuccinate lyase [Variovorax sp. PBL-H6]|uniref:Bug family tripartite tricarboxylate transporter substrate binding protein n=1 Tax=Variovorax sp. PBL-H6 TaxID=434009 RepID=UPI0013181AF0|nr:tripartite tricarboxylate transporter substrate binding protein [Variovorax sp. PBL-H6]VTU15113.1 Argininosuccinate lyase [Variovorax sp. PBL-H6]
MKTWKSLVGALLAAASLASIAQSDYPNKPIKIIIPFGPGGATDNVARQLSVKLGEELKTSIVLDNRPGAAGNIAVDLAARATPDGYTLLLGNVSTNAINQWLYQNQLKTQPSDLTPITSVATVPSILVSSAKFPPNTVQELVAYGKAHPGEINHATAGSGSYAMIDMMAFERAAGLQMVHVPFKGGAGQYVMAQVANDVQISFTNASSVVELVRAGKLKALAVTGDSRLPLLAQVPTMAETGYKGIGSSGWQGLFAPAGTPAPIIQRLHQAVNKVLADKDVRESYSKMLILPLGSASPSGFAAFVRTDSERWKQLVTDLKITLD